MAARKAAEPPPPAQLAELERALAGPGPLARGYVVRGDERWFRDAALAAIVDGAARRGLDVARHDGADPDFDAAALVADLSAPSLFAPARLLVVRGAGALLKKEGSVDAPVASAALAFLRGGAVAGSLVIEAESLRIDHAVAKAVVDTGGTVLTLRPLYDSPPPWERDADPRKTELVQWILARAREKAVRIDPNEAAYLAAATGNDLSALDAALASVAHSGGKGLRSTVAWSGAGSPFQLAEDLLRGDAAASVAGVEALFRSGMRERDGSREVKPEALLAVLFGTLRAKLRQTLAAARADAAGTRLDLAMAPRAREELEARRALRTADAWAAMLEDLAELERRTRTSRTVDANDLVLLALRWRRPEVRKVRGVRA